MSFILICLQMTADFLTQIIHGTVIIMNHYEEVWSDLQSFQLPPIKRKISPGSYWWQLTLLKVYQSHLTAIPRKMVHEKQSMEDSLIRTVSNSDLNILLTMIRALHRIMLWLADPFQSILISPK